MTDRLLFLGLALGEMLALVPVLKKDKSSRVLVVVVEVILA